MRNTYELKIGTSFLLALLSLHLACGAAAQTSTTSLQGTMTDPSAPAVAGATCTADDR